MRCTDHAVEQLEKLVKKWEALKKNKARRTVTQVANEEAFCQTLTDLFDVAHQEALLMIKIEEDRQFLLAQREHGREGCMTGFDMSLTKKEERQASNQKRQLEFKKKHEIEMDNLNQSVTLYFSSSSSGTDDDECNIKSDASSGATGEATAHEEKPRKCKSKYGKTDIWTPAVLSSLDHTKTSDRNAVQIIAPVIQATGEDVEKHTISQSSIRRSRMTNRIDMSSQLKFEFKPQLPMVLHWDGKPMADLTGDEKVE